MFRKLRQLKAEKQGLSVADERHYTRLRRQLENVLLEHADVVCTTCVGAGDPRLLSFRFQHVLVDESTQASEAEALIPLTLGAKQVMTGCWGLGAGVGRKGARCGWAACCSVQPTRQHHVLPVCTDVGVENVTGMFSRKQYK